MRTCRKIPPLRGAGGCHGRVNKRDCRCFDIIAATFPSFAELLLVKEHPPQGRNCWRDLILKHALTLLSFTLLLGILLTTPSTLAQQQSQIRPPKKNEKWLRVQTENFTIYSGAAEKTAKLIAANLERLRKTLTLLTSAMTVNAPVPTAVFLFKNDKAFEPYIFRVRDKTPALAGYFLARSDGNYIAMSAEREASRIIFHEYLHFFMNNNLPSVPLWLNEGLAEYYSTFSSDDDNANIGFPIRNHLDYLQTQHTILKAGYMMPLHQLFAVQEGAIFHEEETRQGIFYAQSWLLVHYLMQGEEGKLRPQFLQFFTLLAKGRSQDQAFAEAFSLDKTQLEKNLQKYLRQSRFNYTQLTSTQLDITIPSQVAAMSYEEFLFHLGDLLAHVGEERLSDAEAFFNEALAANPNYGHAHAGLSYIAGERGKLTEARSHFEKAVQLGPPRAVTHFHFGEGLMASIKSREGWNSKDKAVSRSAREARAAFRTAVDLDFRFVTALAAFGETYLFASSDSLAEGITALEIASAQLPSRMDLALNLLTLYARAGDSTKAGLVLDKVLKPSGKSSIIGEAQERLLVIEFEKAVQAFEQNKNEHALQILARIQGKPYTARFKKQMADLRRAAEHKLHLDLYGSALIKAANKKFEEALERFQQVVEVCDDAELKESSQQELQEVRHHQHVEWYNQAVDLMNKKQPKKAVPLLKCILVTPGDEKLAQAAKELLKHAQQLQSQ